MADYFDYGSPVKRAREAAREELPCEGCGAEGEPVVRTHRPYSTGWSESAGAFYACPGCGRPLVDLPEPSSSRHSEFTIDRVPDPAGLIRRAVRIAWRRIGGEAGSGDIAVEVARALEEVLNDHHGRFEVVLPAGSLPGGVPDPAGGDGTRPGIFVIRHPSIWLGIGLARGDSVAGMRAGLARFVAATGCECGCLVISGPESVPLVEVIHPP